MLYKCNKCCQEKQASEMVKRSNGQISKLCKLCKAKGKRDTRAAKKNGTFVNKMSLEYRSAKFLTDADKIHGGTYGYDSVIYVDALTEVNIYCKVHQKCFPQQPFSHLSGAGCPDCAVNGYKRHLSGCLYVMASDEYVKVGISNNSPTERAKAISTKSPSPFNVLRVWHWKHGAIAHDIETIVLQQLRGKYKNPEESFSGWTECFVSVSAEEVASMVEQAIKEYT